MARCKEGDAEGESSTIDELLASDDQPMRVRMSPARAIWYGRRRQILFVYVQMLEQGANGEWRLMCEQKPFQSHVRQSAVLLKVVLRARRKYGLRNDDWRIAGVDFDEEHFVCHLESPRFRPRRIECILKRCEPMLTKKQGRHFGALINKAIKNGGVGVLESDAEVKKMWHQLIYNGWILKCRDFCKNDGKEFCRFHVFAPERRRKAKGTPCIGS